MFHTTTFIHFSRLEHFLAPFLSFLVPFCRLKMYRNTYDVDDRINVNEEDEESVRKFFFLYKSLLLVFNFYIYSFSSQAVFSKTPLFSDQNKNTLASNTSHTRESIDKISVALNVIQLVNVINLPCQIPCGLLLIYVYTLSKLNNLKQHSLTTSLEKRPTTPDISGVDYKILLAYWRGNT